MNISSLMFAEVCSLDQLTPRERGVLEHLAQHKTSKQIALALGITENTVNKHIAAVREKWGTRDRNETARLFLQLDAEGDENHPPQILPRDDYLIIHPEPTSDLPQSTKFRLSDVLASESLGFLDEAAPEGLEALDARFGKAWRMTAIPLTALLFGMVLLCGLALAMAFSELL